MTELLELRAFPLAAAPAGDEVIERKGAGAEGEDDDGGEEEEERGGGEEVVGVEAPQLFEGVLFGREVGDDEVDDERDRRQSAEQTEREEDAAEGLGETDEPGIFHGKRNAEAGEVLDGLFNVEELAGTGLHQLNPPRKTDQEEERRLKMVADPNEKIVEGVEAANKGVG